MGEEQSASKRERMHLRLDAESKRKLELAAAVSNQTVSQFVLAHALARANRVIEGHVHVRLSASDWAAFMDALVDPPAPSEALVDGFRRYLEDRQ